MGARHILVQRSEILKELLAQQTSATLLLNNTVELGEKLYPSTALEGRETIRLQLQELQQALEALYDGVSSTERELQAKLSRYASMEGFLCSLYLTVVSLQMEQFRRMRGKYPPLA